MKAATAVIDRRALRHNLQQVPPGAAKPPDCRCESKRLWTWPAGNSPHPARRRLLRRGAHRRGADAAPGGIVKPILLLEGFFCAEDLPVLVANNIETAVHSIEQLEALEQAELARPVPVWMKLDTGMHRLGCAPNRRKRFISACAPAANVAQPVNIMSHFSRADEPEPTPP